MESGLPTATLLHFKPNHKRWTAIMEVGAEKKKVSLPLDNLMVFEGGSLRDIKPSEKRPKPERQKAVLLQLDKSAPELTVIGWALAN